jgi:hypothetical protein
MNNYTHEWQRVDALYVDDCIVIARAYANCIKYDIVFDFEKGWCTYTIRNDNDMTFNDQCIMLDDAQIASHIIDAIRIHYYDAFGDES